VLPESFLATLRYLAIQTGSTFATAVGTSAAAWDYDEELALLAAFHETEGFAEAVRRYGRPITIRHPEQFTDLREAIRNEPGLQGSAELQQSLLGVSEEEGGGFSFLGLKNHSSHDVPTSGGDHIGCAYVPGAIAWVVASTMAITPRNPAQTLWVPEFGLIVERDASSNVATAKFDGNAWFGVGKLSSALFPQFKLRSVNN
jgi:hypothetical protein